MGSEALAELCSLLVRNNLGDTAASIFSTLAQHGRLSLPALAERSKTPTRRLRQSLSTLLEEQMVSCYTADANAPSFYSVNWRAAYSLARHINIVQVVAERYGDGAGQIINNILQLGHARVGDLVDAYDLTPASKGGSGIHKSADHQAEQGMVNGIGKTSTHKPAHNQHINTVSEFHSTMRQLLKAGILAKVGSRALMASADIQEQIGETVMAEFFPDGKVNGQKKKAEFDNHVNRLKRKFRDEDSYSDVHDLESKGTFKRPGEYFQADNNKRLKVNGNGPNGHLEDAVKLSSDLIVCVDFPRCTLAMRSHALEQLAKRFLGSVTASVYGALLQTLESKIQDLDEVVEGDDDERHLPLSTLTEVAEVLDPTLELATSIKGLSSGKDVLNGVHKKGKHQIIEEEDFSEIGVKRERPSDDEDEPTTNGFTSYRDRAKRIQHIEQHLSLLEEHPKQFCKRARKHGGSNEWLVDLRALTDKLIDAELDSVVGARYGKTALRLTRLLRERGKLDEKQVGLFAMMRLKDVRAILTELQFHGILDAQELPKDASRQPSRTAYLWFFDTKRVQSMITQQTYKAMSRTIQRVFVERESYRGVIDKAERSDVKGREQEKLEQVEKTTLRAWRETEERLFSQVARMDEVVALLRDYNGKDTSMT
ncbi:hypothetical protein EJ03DRAFT_388087 [Teratosphaeria nubilosa]|uniref:DNA-directed RNA polymerase III subunit RPC3 n=1 Tax=Teratosphaeria nubilosa TaxID=161662 RepID=A0A6G1LGA8_9PEZI|nr:hypothetical protein EJ03DRAFT_388087 [Teratosphaeria nubilosa]